MARDTPDTRVANFRHVVPMVDRRVFEMYRDAMDQATRKDIAAATAAHQELGRDYDDAIAESLVDRIGAEIDKRIDARLRTGPSGSRPPAKSSPSGKGQALFLGAGIGAGLTGLVSVVAQHGSKHVLTAVIVIWIILAVAGLGTAVVSRYRNMSAQVRATSTYDHQ
jgi:VIT1/CCC1 family predicted Fe2+/Mn2+ transporter